MTTACAVLIGVILVNIIQPGVSANLETEITTEPILERENVGLSELIKSLISPNKIHEASNTQLLPIIVFCLLFGAALTTIGKNKKSIINFFDELNEVMMKLVMWIMLFAPIGVFSLVASQFARVGGGENIKAELIAVGSYFFTVILGLLCHFLLLFLILIIFSTHGKQYLLK